MTNIETETLPSLSPLTPPPGSPEELILFAQLQEKLLPHYQRVFSDPKAPRTVVVIPSLSLDMEELQKISGAHHYEERMLCLLMLLKLPCTHVVFVTSQPIPDSIIDYYLHLLPGVPTQHARRRLTLLSCHDSSSIPLTQKILQRPRLIQRIRASIANPDSAHITCFNSTPLERTLAVQLGIPLYANNPALAYLGSKSYSREIFRQAGVTLPDGFEHLQDEQDIIEALVALKKQHPTLPRAVIKINEGFSGEGNASFSYEGAPIDHTLASWIREQLPQRIRFEAQNETWEHYIQKFRQMGGVVELWIDGKIKRSPSVQCRITPTRELELISTHDQLLGGPSGQIFLGSTFPAHPEYRLDLHDAGLQIANVLQQYGVLGRFGIDFVSVKSPEGNWVHYAIEINLRKGGTTFPFLMLQFLTNGQYNEETGEYYIPTGQTRYYYTTDNLQQPAYKGLIPDDLIDIMVYHSLHFHGALQQGVVFHLMGALSQHGKSGIVCIGDSYEKARKLYTETAEVLSTKALTTPVISDHICQRT